MTSHSIYPLASNEEEKTTALYNHHISDNASEKSFDKLISLTARTLNVPIALMILINGKKIWIKAKYGINIQSADDWANLCSRMILSNNLYVVEDMSDDPLILSNPLVKKHDLKFCAAVPLKTKDGFNLGTFCIMDKQPRRLTEFEEILLEDLRDIVMDQIELKHTLKIASERHQQILNTTAHDLKNPLTTIPVRADLIKLKKKDPEAVDKMCDQIKTASLNMVHIIDELLQAGTIEAGQIRLLLVKLNISALITNVISMNMPLAEQKKQTLKFVGDPEILVMADEGKLSEIIDNLINNAIKYSPSNTSIVIELNQINEKVLLEVKDQGQGLTKDDMSKLYQRFTRLSAQPTGGEKSTGLGLSIVKVMVEAHGGRIWANSDGKNKGTTFCVELSAKL